MLQVSKLSSFPDSYSYSATMARNRLEVRMAPGGDYSMTQIGGAGLIMSFIFSLIILGLSASVVAHDHQSKIAIAHLVVVRPSAVTYTYMPLRSILMLI